MHMRARELRAGDVLHLGGLKGPVVRWTVEGARAAGAQMIVDVVGAGGGRSVLTLHRERVVVVRREGEGEDEVRDGAVALRELLCEIGQGAVDQRVIDAIVADACEQKRAAMYRRLRDASEAVSSGGEAMESERLRLERRAAKRAQIMGEGSGINVAVGDLVMWSASGKILAVDTRLPNLTLTVFDAARHVVPHKVFTTATLDEQRLCQALALHVLDLATFEIHLGHGSSVRVDFDRFREWQHIGDTKVYECPPEVVAWLS